MSPPEMARAEPGAIFRPSFGPSSRIHRLRIDPRRTMDIDAIVASDNFVLVGKGQVRFLKELATSPESTHGALHGRVSVEQSDLRGWVTLDAGGKRAYLEYAINRGAQQSSILRHGDWTQPVELSASKDIVRLLHVWDQGEFEQQEEVVWLGEAIPADVGRILGSLRLQQVLDPQTEPTERAQLLEETIDELPELAEETAVELASFVSQEISQHELPVVWRDAVVYAAEELEFEDSEERTAVVDGLLSHAKEMRDSQDRESPLPLWAAIRAYASLVPEEEADNLSAFLRGEDVLATKQVALQGVQSIYGRRPPDEPGEAANLRERVAELVDHYLTREMLSAAETAALAKNAIHAAAVLGDEQLPSYLRTVRTLDKRWFTAQVRRALVETGGIWLSGEPAEWSNNGRGALTRLQESVEELDDHNG